MKESVAHPPWFSGETPSADDSVLSRVVIRRADKAPNETLALFPDGSSWTNAETRARMEGAAELLTEKNVRRGDHVAVWLPNGADLFQLWLACSHVGAVFIPLNTDYRGSILGHALSECAPELLVLHPSLADRLDLLDRYPANSVLICGESKASIYPALGGLPTSAREPIEAAQLEPWDPHMVIFTSGTTGASKGVLCPYGHIYSTAQATYGYLNDQDTMLTELPIFHVGGAASVVAALCNGSRLAIYPGFSTHSYWDRVAAVAATSTSGLIGSMADFLASTPVTEQDADNSLRIMTLMLTEQAMGVAKRFDFQTLSGFNMTELSGPLITELDCQVAGSLGRPRTGCECRVVDEHDMLCPDGEVGELVVRHEHPWTLFAGYLNRPDATADAWRNGWFHTGDLVRKDSSGNYFYVDRKKDAIRRRGENVSSAEVEAEALAHPQVQEACAVAVPSEQAEDEILLAYVSSESLAPKALAEFLVPRMPHFMVPRYFRAVSELPRTPTNKVRKVAVRETGITEDTWDREAHGMVLKRTRF